MTLNIIRLGLQPALASPTLPKCLLVCWRAWLGAISLGLLCSWFPQGT